MEGNHIPPFFDQEPPPFDDDDDFGDFVSQTNPGCDTSPTSKGALWSQTGNENDIGGFKGECDGSEWGAFTSQEKDDVNGFADFAAFGVKQHDHKEGNLASNEFAAFREPEVKENNNSTENDQNTGLDNCKGDVGVENFANGGDPLSDKPTCAAANPSFSGAADNINDVVLERRKSLTPIDVEDHEPSCSADEPSFASSDGKHNDPSGNAPSNTLSIKNAEFDDRPADASRLQSAECRNDNSTTSQLHSRDDNGTNIARDSHKSIPAKDSNEALVSQKPGSESKGLTCGDDSIKSKEPIRPVSDTNCTERLTIDDKTEPDGISLESADDDDWGDFGAFAASEKTDNKIDSNMEYQELQSSLPTFSDDYSVRPAIVATDDKLAKNPVDSKSDLDHKQTTEDSLATLTREHDDAVSVSDHTCDVSATITLEDHTGMLGAECSSLSSKQSGKGSPFNDDAGTASENGNIANENELNNDKDEDHFETLERTEGLDFTKAEDFSWTADADSSSTPASVPSPGAVDIVNQNEISGKNSLVSSTACEDLSGQNSSSGIYHREDSGNSLAEMQSASEVISSEMNLSAGPFAELPETVSNDQLVANENKSILHASSQWEVSSGGLPHEKHNIKTDQEDFTFSKDDDQWEDFGESEAATSDRPNRVEQDSTPGDDDPFGSQTAEQDADNWGDFGAFSSNEKDDDIANVDGNEDQTTTDKKSPERRKSDEIQESQRTHRASNFSSEDNWSDFNSSSSFTLSEKTTNAIPPDHVQDDEWGAFDSDVATEAHDAPQFAVGSDESHVGTKRIEKKAMAVSQAVVFSYLEVCFTEPTEDENLKNFLAYPVCRYLSTDANASNDAFYSFLKEGEEEDASEFMRFVKTYYCSVMVESFGIEANLVESNTPSVVLSPSLSHSIDSWEKIDMEPSMLIPDKPTLLHQSQVKDEGHKELTRHPSLSSLKKEGESGSASETASLDLDFFTGGAASQGAETTTAGATAFDLSSLDFNDTAVVKSEPASSSRATVPLNKDQGMTQRDVKIGNIDFSTLTKKNQRQDALSSSTTTFLENLDDITFMNSSVLMFPAMLLPSDAEDL